MEPGTLTHLDRIVILFAVIGGVLVVLLPMIVVLMTPEKKTETGQSVVGSRESGSQSGVGSR